MAFREQRAPRPLITPWGRVLGQVPLLSHKFLQRWEQKPGGLLSPWQACSHWIDPVPLNPSCSLLSLHERTCHASRREHGPVWEQLIIRGGNGLDGIVVEWRGAGHGVLGHL